MTFYRGDLYVATLGSQALVRIQFGENYQVRRIERWFAKTPSSGIYGRLRDVTVGQDGHLYVTTSNTDGRAELRPRDDKILRIQFKPSKPPLRK
jgi:glucose/arabinose dehydrogenase